MDFNVTLEFSLIICQASVSFRVIFILLCHCLFESSKVELRFLRLRLILLFLFRWPISLRSMLSITILSFTFCLSTQLTNWASHLSSRLVFLAILLLICSFKSGKSLSITDLVALTKFGLISELNVALTRTFFISTCCLLSTLFRGINASHIFPNEVFLSILVHVELVPRNYIIHVNYFVSTNIDVCLLFLLI